MKLKIYAFVITASFLMGREVLAQDYVAMVRRPVSQVEFATAIKDNDQSILYVPCMTYYVTANRIFKKNFTRCEEFADYVGRLTVTSCPQEVARLTRVSLKNRTVNPDDYIERRLRLGELCLYDNNEARWIATLSCGNLFLSEHSVYTAMVTDGTEKVSPQSVSGAPSSSLPADTTATDDELRKRVGDLAAEASKKAGTDAAIKEDKIVSTPLQGGASKHRFWLGKNWKWVVPTAGVLAGVGILAWQNDWFTNKNVQINEVNIYR